LRYKTAKELKDAEFKRSTGVSREMFEKMLLLKSLLETLPTHRGDAASAAKWW
jgi:hypothetical protein